MSCEQKLIQIITSNTLEDRVKKIFRKAGIVGFTFFNVSGEGETGVQSGHFDADSNILFMVMVNGEQFERLKEELMTDIKKGYHYFFFSVNAEVLTPSKC
jgi:nitrogen regulatory protein PII